MAKRSKDVLKKIRVEDAIGKPLFHDLTGIMADGFKGVVFKKGHIIKKEDIDKLKDIGKEHIFVGSLEEGFVHEEDAIKNVADDLMGKNTYYTDPKEGKISIKSKTDGLFIINRKALFGLNMVGDYTLATIPSFSIVKKDQNLVGARIVPLYTKKENMEKFKDLALKERPIFEVRKFQKLKVGVIITGNEIYTGRIKDLFEPIIRKKLIPYEKEILGIEKCPDDLAYIKKKLGEFLEKGADLIVFSGGMSVDPDDLTPTIIRQMSDEFITQGLPVQPGNMLTVGRKNGAYLVGVPGASIHADFTSFDIFLPRFFAKLNLKKKDFIELGEGGLL